MEKDFLIKAKEDIFYEEKHLILIIYDIVDNKRRNKFFKLLSGYMIPVQKSCFESHLTESEFEKLAYRIPFYIDKEEDNVRCYKLSAHGKVYNFGSEKNDAIEDIVIFWPMA